MNQQLDLDLGYSPVTPAQPSKLSQLRNLVEQLERQRVSICAALDCAGGTHTFDDVVDAIVGGRLLFMPLDESFYILEVLVFPQTKHLHIFLGGGDLNELVGQHDKIIEIAKFNGCSAVTIAGRSGWVKPLLKHNKGWRHNCTNLILGVDQ